jgi:uncharacterized protein YecT (DUF1311 family)
LTAPDTPSADESLRSAYKAVYQKANERNEKLLTDGDKSNPPSNEYKSKDKELSNKILDLQTAQQGWTTESLKANKKAVQDKEGKTTASVVKDLDYRIKGLETQIAELKKLLGEPEKAYVPVIGADGKVVNPEDLNTDRSKSSSQ